LIIIFHEIKLEKKYFLSSVQSGGREVSPPNESSLLFCEFYFIKVLVMAKRRLQDAEM
jgi:hypothetical protein